MKGLVRYFLLLLVIFCLQIREARAVSRSWTGATATAGVYDFNTASNWSPSGVPTSSDDLTITVPLFLFNPPTVTGTASCKSLTFSALLSLSTLTLNVNGSLTVAGDIIQTPTLVSGYTTLITGSGLLTCNGSLKVGDPNPLSTLLTGVLNTNIKVISTLNNLSITGNINCYKSSISGLLGGILGTTVGSFSLQRGNTKVSGQILTQNTSTNFSSTPTFSIDAPDGGNPTLTLTNAIPIAPTSLASSIDFYNSSGTGTCTVEYNNNIDAIQTVYAATDNILNNIPTTYQFLTMSGTATKRVNGTVLNVDKDWISGGGIVDLMSNNPTVNINRDWTNSCTVNQGTGDITVKNSLTNNTGGILNLSSANLFIGGNYTNNANNGYVQGTGTTFFNGSGAQTLQDNSTITGTTFKKITFSGINAASISTIIPGIGNFAVASSGTLTMLSTAKLIAGNLLTDASATGYLTLLSDATSTATVAAIPTSASISGNVNVQRFITGGTGYRGYRLMTSPVNTSNNVTGNKNISLSYINQNQTFNNVVYRGSLTAGQGTGFTTSNINPIIYLYDESRPSNNTTFVSGKNIGIYSITGNTVTTLTGTTQTSNISIPVGNSFLFYYIGDNSSINLSASTRTPESSTPTAVGYLNQGDIPVKFWNTNSTNIPYTVASPGKLGVVGYNQVGNPYASTISLDLVYSTNQSASNNISPIFWEMNGKGSTYISYNASTHTSQTATNAGNFIVSGQGFLVDATATGQTLTFKESQKVAYPSSFTSTTSPGLLMSTPDQKRVYISQKTKIPTDKQSTTSTVVEVQAVPTGPIKTTLQGLHLKITKDSLTDTETGIYFSPDWSDKFNLYEDAVDLDGASPKVYISSYSSDNKRLSINQLSDYKKGKIIPLFVNATTDGIYKLSMVDIQNIDTLYNVFLKDQYTKDSLDIRHNRTYNFNILKNDTSTFGGYRFKLVIRRKALPPYKLISFTAQKKTDGIKISWTTYNEDNYIAFTVEKQEIGSSSQFNRLYASQSNGSRIYYYTDQHPFTGINTYRLKQIGIDSTTTYSEAISVNFDASQTDSNNISVYPNPAKESVQITMNGTTASATHTAAIYNSNGIMLVRKSSAGNNWSQDVSNFTPGLYIIQISDKNGGLVGQAKFIKNK